MHFTKSAPKASRFFSTKLLEVYSTGPATHGMGAMGQGQLFLVTLTFDDILRIEMIMLQTILQNHLLLCMFSESTHPTTSKKIMMTYSVIVQTSEKITSTYIYTNSWGPAKWCTTKLFCRSFTTSKWRWLPYARCILEHQPSELPPVVMHS